MKNDYVYGHHAVDLLREHQRNNFSYIYLLANKKDHFGLVLQDWAKQQNIPVKYLARDELTQLCGSEKHQGVVVALQQQIASRNENDLLSFLTTTKRHTFLILDGVQDPHNLGACLRTADAAGVTAVIVPRDNAVGLTPVVRKVASGAAETVPLVQVTNLVRAIKLLQEHRVWVYGAIPEAEQNIYEIKFDESIALVLGSEGSGMRRLTRETCDFLFHLPMQGSITSLNVSVATGICLYEILRQRMLLR